MEIIDIEETFKRYAKVKGRRKPKESYSKHQEKKEFHLLGNEMQLLNKGYFLLYFRMPPVIFKEPLRKVALLKNNGQWSKILLID